MKNISGILWFWGVIVISIFLVMPILTIILSVLEPNSDNWEHLKDTVLLEYIINSIILASGVGFGAFIIGVASAWVTSVCQFPGRNIFIWLLLLPMSMPSYIVAYTYTGMLDFSGPFQTIIRDWSGLGYGEYYFPQIRSMGGAIVMMSLVLYPYVYLLALSLIHI